MIARHGRSLCEGTARAGPRGAFFLLQGTILGRGHAAIHLLILDVVAIIRVLQGKGDPMMKLVWVLVILLLPLLGPILYFLIGEKRL